MNIQPFPAMDSTFTHKSEVNTAINAIVSQKLAPAYWNWAYRGAVTPVKNQVNLYLLTVSDWILCS